MRSKFLMAILSLILIIGMAGTIFMQIYQSDAEEKRLKKEQADQLSSFNANISNSIAKNNEDKQKYLKIEDTVIGTGTEVKSGDTVTINYKGMLEDGTVFDENFTTNKPFSTPIGVGYVIKGWDEGIVGMKVGGKRKLTIQPEWGYGNRAQPKIPANSVLIFETELLDVEPAAINSASIGK